MDPLTSADLGLLRLVLTPGWGARRIHTGLERFGTVDRLIERAREVGPAGDLADDAQLRDVLDRCRAAGVRLLSRADPGFPARLLHLPDPPPILFWRGDPRVLERPMATVVGSRRSTVYGRRVAGEVGRATTTSGWVVVSGMALGIDGAAHRGALDAGGATVAVLGSGPDRAHPGAHRALMEEILEEGLVLSEHPPGTPPLSHHFPRRNRILAALGRKVVVVEAARRSGALITARLGAEMGREIWAVPGPILSDASVGANALLEDGAVPLCSLEAWVGRLREEAGSETSPGIGSAPAPELDGVFLEVWRALDGEPTSPEELSRRTRLPVHRLLGVLTSLELRGWVQRVPGPGFLRHAA